MRYNGQAIEWCAANLNYRFDCTMTDEIGRWKYPAVAWRDGKHELYCMGGEL